MAYAKSTTVSSDKSRAEIERTLERYGATSFMYGWSQEHAVIAFEMNGRRLKFELPLPSRDNDEFVFTPTKRQKRAPAAAKKAYEQAVRQRWRALALVIKAKLEAVKSGISVFDEEFLAQIVLPDGGTVGQFMIPQVALAYENGTLPTLLPAPSSQLILDG